MNLAVLINTVKQQLVDAGFGIAERIPEVAASFTDRPVRRPGHVAEPARPAGRPEHLAARGRVALLPRPWLIARDRPPVGARAGLAVAGSMLLLGATLNVIRPFYLDALPESSSAAAAGAIYDQLVSFIRVALRGCSWWR